MNRNIRFFHSRTTPSKGGTTACLMGDRKLDISEAIPRTITLNVGMSFCSNEDNFCKKIGRELAQARVNSCEFRLIGTDFYGVLYYSELDNIFVSVDLDTGFIRFISHNKIQD